MSKRWYQPSKPSELQPVPWLAPQVVTYLEGIIQPEWEVIEHGSGGSTLWFAERVKCVMAFENNLKWWEIVTKQTPRNAHVIFDNWGSGVADNWREFAPFDLLLIDGEPVTDRAEWLRLAPSIVRPGGWIVLDNANRPEYKADREALLKHCDLIKSFNGNEGGTEYLVTEFYKIKKGSE